MTINQYPSHRQQRIFLFTFLVLFLFASFSLTAYTETLNPFTSDGCSSFPDGTFDQNQLWLNCCKAHDFAYWKGGTYQQRLEADEALQSCVEKTGEPEIALLMLAGVRVGGTPFLPTNFRWGYGWPYPRFYGELTAEEADKVQALINKSE